MVRSICAAFIIFVLLLFFAAPEAADENGIFDRRTVRMVDRFKEADYINYHCWSDDDDLGNRTFLYMESWYWQFRVNFWGTTKFTCNFESYDIDLRDFPVFDRKISKLCGTNCTWYLVNDGPCLVKPGTETYIYCRYWDYKH